MAQTGYSPVLLYSSTTAGNTPAAPSLLNSANGSEVAINIADGKLFYKDNAGAVQLLASKNAAAGIFTNLSVSGNISSPLYIQYGNGSATTLAAGRSWYDEITGSWNLGMGGGNIAQQVGEETFIYGKASANIAEGQLIVKTGTVGASGVITFGPSPTGLMVNDGIIGMATENITSGNFGRITVFGVIHGINTTGSSVGETWADNDTLYYNPSYAGGLTKVKPSAPYVKYEVATVINAGGGGSGSIQVNLQPGSTLGGTDSNVQFGTLNGGDLIQYNSTLGYWTNVSPLLAGGTQLARLATSASVASGGQFFTSTVRPMLLAGHLYRISYNLVFTKATAGTVTFGFSNSAAVNFAPINANLTLMQQGYSTTSTSDLFATGATTAAFQATLALADATTCNAFIEGYVIAASDTRLQLTVTDSAGTITSQLGSYFSVTDLGTSTTIGNIG